MHCFYCSVIGMCTEDALRKEARVVVVGGKAIIAVTSSLEDAVDVGLGALRQPWTLELFPV